MQRYKEVKTLAFQNAVVRVHIPELTREERNRRMTEIHKTAASLLKELHKRKAS